MSHLGIPSLSGHVLFAETNLASPDHIMSYPVGLVKHCQLRIGTCRNKSHHVSPGRSDRRCIKTRLILTCWLCHNNLGTSLSLSKHVTLVMTKTHAASLPHHDLPYRSCRVCQASPRLILHIKSWLKCASHNLSRWSCPISPIRSNATDHGSPGHVGLIATRLIQSLKGTTCRDGRSKQI